MEYGHIDKHKMRERLQALRLEAAPYSKMGKVATYIPELGKSDPTQLIVSVTFPDGETISAGDGKKKLTLQSISKIFTLMLALEDLGPDEVFSKVGMEPTGDPFNSIIKLETIKPHKPLNPMINAGAIVVSSMIKGANIEEQEHRLTTLLQKLTGSTSITVNQEVYQSELFTADRNRALAYFMRDSGVFKGNVDEILDFYFRHCAMELSTEEISRAAAVLACDGRDLLTGEQIVSKHIARICKTFMITCGMYNASGEFAISAGFPAKSGVSGGIMASVPNKLGIGVYGPALDDKGNSIAGVKLLEGLSMEFDLSIF